MPGATKLMTAGGGGVNLQPASSIASDVTVQLPVVSQTLIGNKTPGTVLQVVQTVKTDSFTTTSASLVDITGFNATITPSSATSKILVIVSANGSVVTNNAYFQLVRDSTNVYQGSGASFINCSAAIYPVGQYVEQYIPMTYLDSPATTSAVTYKLRVGQDSGGSTVGINRRSADAWAVYPCSITLMEIAA